jgi:hypothetical protein
MNVDDDPQLVAYQSMANLMIKHLPGVNFVPNRVFVIRRLIDYVAVKYPDADLSHTVQHLPVHPHTAMSELTDVWLRYDTSEKISAVTLLVINSVVHSSVDE